MLSSIKIFCLHKIFYPLSLYYKYSLITSKPTVIGAEYPFVWPRKIIFFKPNETETPLIIWAIDDLGNSKKEK